MVHLAINNLRDEDFKMVNTIHMFVYRLITPCSVVGSYHILEENYVFTSRFEL
jgi:hypothetical protein